MSRLPDRLRARRLYKSLLKDIVEGRPSGTKQRIARAAGSSRSFVSQLLNPDSEVPLPERHVATIMNICEFTEGEAQDFLELYEAAHPKRRSGKLGSDPDSITISLPKFASAEQRRAVEEAILETAEKIIDVTIASNRRKPRRSRKN